MITNESALEYRYNAVHHNMILHLTEAKHESEVIFTKDTP